MNPKLGFLIPLLLASGAVLCADTKVACVGNSITFGYGLANQYLENYPLRLDTLLGTGWATSNLGNSGKTMLRAVGDAYWSQPEFPKAMALLPNVVVIELGTNDAKDYIWTYHKSEFAKDYRAMIDTFRTLSSKPQVWATLQPRANNISWSMPDTTIARQVNPLIQSTAMSAAAGIIDLRTGLAGHPEWFQSDSVHPNAAGALALAKVVAGMLKHAPVTVTESGGSLSATQGASYQWYRDDVLLAGDSARTLASRTAGNYKVSVRVDAGSQSRIVSAPYTWTPGGTALAARSRGEAMVVIDRSGQIRAQLPAGRSMDRFELRDRSGRLVPGQCLLPGVYLWEIVSGATRWTGNVVVARTGR
jgi:lysophospholipase L1-like esterase